MCKEAGFSRAIWILPEHSWMSDKPQKPAIVKADQATFSTNTFMDC